MRTTVAASEFDGVPFDLGGECGKFDIDLGSQNSIGGLAVARIAVRLRPGAAWNYRAKLVRRAKRPARRRAHVGGYEVDDSAVVSVVIALAWLLMRSPTRSGVYLDADGLKKNGGKTVRPPVQTFAPVWNGARGGTSASVPSNGKSKAQPAPRPQQFRCDARHRLCWSVVNALPLLTRKFSG